jgi:hypothetical protein
MVSQINSEEKMIQTINANLQAYNYSATRGAGAERQAQAPAETAADSAVLSGGSDTQEIKAKPAKSGGFFAGLKKTALVAALGAATLGGMATPAHAGGWWARPVMVAPIVAPVMVAPALPSVSLNIGGGGIEFSAGITAPAVMPYNPVVVCPPTVLPIAPEVIYRPVPVPFYVHPHHHWGLYR